MFIELWDGDVTKSFINQKIYWALNVTKSFINSNRFLLGFKQKNILGLERLSVLLTERVY